MIFGSARDPANSSRRSFHHIHTAYAANSGHSTAYAHDSVFPSRARPSCHVNSHSIPATETTRTTWSFTAPAENHFRCMVPR